MILLPAIDLYGGKVVRLTKGDFSERTEYAADPYRTAQKFASLGCKNIHIVDLEGAKTGSPKHLAAVSEIASLGMEIEYGGGLRDAASIRSAINAGVTRVMAGSILFGGENAPHEIFAEFGEAIMPSVDTRGGKVVISGWKDETDLTPAPCLKKLSAIGFTTFLVTSVERDGMLEGPDMELYAELLSATNKGTRVIAAGGVTTVDDVKRLKLAGLYGAVVGKAIYERNFDITAALETIGE
ncbi:1-(5-phosphoribosyl)-5-[(5-phosphoribosylamino) methylideneamino] imidazole-4-carboxamide isomerase [Synergistales bacterium]|nr:1-(5-phosphoribosyl)-5-[(5-phosphoribosylamino) methylideneamino] imidazole-4-carboxamide isomerase [Synergistales bacterium]